MDIYMFWLSEDDFIWLDTAWDDDSIAENPEGYRLAKEDMEAKYGSKFKIIKAHIDFDKVQKAFDTPDAGELDVL